MFDIYDWYNSDPILLPGINTHNSQRKFCMVSNGPKALLHKTFLSISTLAKTEIIYP